MEKKCREGRLRWYDKRLRGLSNDEVGSRNKRSKKRWEDCAREDLEECD